MNLLPLQARMASLISTYGEAIAGTRSGTSVALQALVSIAPSSSTAQLSGVVLQSGTGGGSVTTSPTAIPEVYPKLALFFDPSLPASGTPGPILPAAGDTFVRDGVTLVLKEPFTYKPADVPIVLVMIALPQ